jgi:hypothetical protein
VYDSSTGLWRYTYALRNGADAQQDILTFEIRFNGPASEISSPPAWHSLNFPPPAAIPGISWNAELPTDYSAGYLVGPSPAQIPQGDSLSGFVVTSPFPPGYARTYVQGFAGVPLLPDSLSYEDYETPEDTLNAQRGWTLGPTRYLKVVTGGNRRPAVDGFLGFMNLAVSGSIVRNPAPIALKFSLNGETVFRETLKVELNGVDVTTAFYPSPTDGADLVGVFRIGSSALQAGKNVLLTSVEGLTAAGQRTKDTDRITFTVDANRTAISNSLLNDPSSEPELP